MSRVRRWNYVVTTTEILVCKKYINIYNDDDEDEEHVGGAVGISLGGTGRTPSNQRG